MLFSNPPKTTINLNNQTGIHSPSALDLGGVLVEGAEVLDGALQALGEELDVGGNVLVVEAALLEDGELLEHLALDHGDAVLLGHLRLVGLLDEVAEDGQDDARDLLLGAVAQDVRHDRDDVELVHLLREQRVERQHPQTEDQLVLHLEVDAGRQDADDRADAVHVDEREPVLVHAQHHLQATGHRLDVLVGLC